MKLIYLVVFFATVNIAQTFAQTVFEAPTGVYCSCGPTTGVGNGSVDPAIAAKPFVNGILVRVAWNLLEPSPDNYNWSLIDGQIAAANSYGKKISLAIGCGNVIPKWVYTAGAQQLISTSPFSDTLAVPWDTVFLNRWTAFVAALGNHFKNDTTIRLVYITSSTGNGYEMELPPVTSPTLTAAGYTDEKMIASWKTVIDAFNSAFPNHHLTNDFHPVNDSSIVADSVYVYAVSSIGTRYGASAWWWTQRNTTVYAAEYTILQNSANGNGFTGVQMAYSGTSDSAMFGAGGMPAALQLAISDKICYWEIWNNDILNPAFDSLLSKATCVADTDTVASGIGVMPGYLMCCYPNPAVNVFKVELPAGFFCIKVLNVDGTTVYTQKNVSAQIKVDCSYFSTGIYFVQAAGPNGVCTQKVVVID